MSVAAHAITPSGLYQRGIASGEWQDDPDQHIALREMDRLHAAFAAPLERNLWQRWGLQRVTVPQGLYLWGSVGRGKTMLMDLLVKSLPAACVERQHFHGFMQNVHAQLRSIPHERDPLATIGAQLATRIRVLCLDEFQVIDIGDAMLLGGLLRALFSEGVALVTTSNSAPQELYRDGLQRARFLPAIALLEQHCRVLELRSDHDWRLRSLRRAPRYYTPLGPDAVRALQKVFDAAAHGEIQQGGSMRIHQREIPLQRSARGIAWFAFEDLCEGPRAVADYIELAQRCKVVLISALPQFNPDHEDAARRFVHLIDAFYDHGVILIVSAAVPIVELYQGKRLRAEFARTESRLIEMQDENYPAA